MNIHKLLAKKISYDSSKKRSKKSVKYIVIHYTGNSNDTAKNNATYFATSNKREAGAHFFVDKNGKVYKSINMNRTAWSVGGSKYADCSKTGGGTYYYKCTNFNSVSIELCDYTKGYPSKKQVKACKKLVKYIRRYCPNAKEIIRHFDVNGKSCPGPMAGKGNANWKKFKKAIM